jgi:AcrR family transcriptional regulator
MPKRSYHHGNLRPALIAAGLAALAEHGPDGFSLRDVATRAGVSAAAPYRHFADKEALFAAIAEECANEIGAAITRALEGAPPDPLERFRRTGIAYVRFAAERPAHFRALTLPGVVKHMPAAAAGAHQDRQAAEQAELRAGQADNKIAALPLEQLLLAAQASMHGLAHMIVEGQLGKVDPDRAEQLAREVTYALGVGFFPRVSSDPQALRLDGSAKVSWDHGGKRGRSRH